MNTPHIVTVAAPLLRPGLTISATCSERYASRVAHKLLSIAREINEADKPTVAQPLALKDQT